MLPLLYTHSHTSHNNSLAFLPSIEHIRALKIEETFSVYMGFRLFAFSFLAHFLYNFQNFNAFFATLFIKSFRAKVGLYWQSFWWNKIYIKRAYNTGVSSFYLKTYSSNKYIHSSFLIRSRHRLKFNPISLIYRHLKVRIIALVFPIIPCLLCSRSLTCLFSTSF